MLSTSQITALYVSTAPVWLAFLEAEQGKIEKEIQRLKANGSRSEAPPLAASEEDENDDLEP